MEFKDLDPLIPLNSLQNHAFYSIKFKIYSFSSGQDVLTSPQQTRCGPSLVNEVHPVSARHPGNSFPVNLSQEAVPKLTNGSPLPSQP